MSKKLTSSQIHVIETLGKYNCMVMNDRYVTGGYGVKLNLKSVQSLEKLGMVSRGRLTDLGKRAATEIAQAMTP